MDRNIKQPYYINERFLFMITHANGITVYEKKEEFVPVRILDHSGVTSPEALSVIKAPCVSFKTEGCATFNGAGSWILLDFGKEICGSARIIVRAVRNATKQAHWRITFGESVSEACSTIGIKNATNDHSSRDFEIVTPFMSDLTFGQTGYRFLRLELLTDAEVLIRNIFAVSVEPAFEREASIVTSDALLNDIITTAARTLKLCYQNGYAWDGIKRDRLVWCGDLHPEIVTALYLYGDIPNIQNSLDFLRDETPADTWVNNMPPYSAWWVINLCDYCKIAGKPKYYKMHRDYVLAVMSHINECILEDGSFSFPGTNGSETFLDWSTYQTPEDACGAAAVYCLAAQRVLAAEENADSRDILRKLAKYIEADTTRKPIRAFQMLAGRKDHTDTSLLEKDGAADFSTFMAYYILTAMAASGGTQMLPILKDYYGAMLSRGATSFWEDFDITWLEGSSRIDEMPKPGEKDIHGDYGRFCYTQFRHSLCHGWSAGVLAFIIEYVLGVSVAGNCVTVKPHTSGLSSIDAKLPVADGWLYVKYENGRLDISSTGNILVNQK